MNPGEAVGSALDTLASELTPFLSLRETVELLGGTRSAATAFGVTQRTVQRYLAAPGRQQRNLAHSNPRIRAAVAREQRNLAGQEMRKSMKRGYSVAVIVFTIRISQDVTTREREDIPIEEPREEDIDRLIDAWQRGDESGSDDGMLAAFSRSFLHGWGMGRLDAANIEEITYLALATRE